MKIQNTELRIEHGTFNGQWKKYRYFSENLGPLVVSTTKTSFDNNFSRVVDQNIFWSLHLTENFHVCISQECLMLTIDRNVWCLKLHIFLKHIFSKQSFQNIFLRNYLFSRNLVFVRNIFLREICLPMQCGLILHGLLLSCSMWSLYILWPFYFVVFFHCGLFYDSKNY